MTLLLRHLFRPALAVAVAARLGACEHHEPDHAVGSTSVAPVTAKSVAPVVTKVDPPGAHPRCQVPLPEPAPAKVAPTGSCPSDPTGNLKLPHGYVTFSEAPGAPRVLVEVAATDASRERGLMYRMKMPEDEGMIFDWNDAAMRSFWMHDTCIPLDMLFISADNFIAGILEQVPPMDESPRGVPCPVTHVLEVNAGYTRSHGVKPGQRVTIE